MHLQFIHYRHFNQSNQLTHTFTNWEKPSYLLRRLSQCRVNLIHCRSINRTNNNRLCFCPELDWNVIQFMCDDTSLQTTVRLEAFECGLVNEFEY